MEALRHLSTCPWGIELSSMSHSMHFCAGQSPEHMDRSEFSQVTPWPSPDTYNMILKAAHDGAQALVESPQGHLLRTVRDVFIRVDIVLGAKWVNDEEVELMPMINEMDWLNSAGMLTHFWKDADFGDEVLGSINYLGAESASIDAVPLVATAEAGAEAGAEADGTDAAASSRGSQGTADGVLSQGTDGCNEDVYLRALQESHGYRVAHALHAEILNTWRADKES